MGRCDARKGPRTQGCGWPLEVGKGKERDSLPPEGIQPTDTLILALLRLISNFAPSEL